jgi:hypothetical protein
MTLQISDATPSRFGCYAKVTATKAQFYDDVTDDIVGLRDDDGSQILFADLGGGSFNPTFTNLTSGDVPQYTGSEWVNVPLGDLNFSDLNEVGIDTPQDGQYFIYDANAGVWDNRYAIQGALTYTYSGGTWVEPIVRRCVPEQCEFAGTVTTYTGKWASAITFPNTTTSTSVYNGLLSGSTSILFTGTLTDSFSLSVQDIQIPLTCTYLYPVAAGLCNVLALDQVFYKQDKWNLRQYVGIQGPFTFFGTPDVYNYGLARFFNNENPDNLTYKIRIYNTSGTQLQVDIIPGQTGSGTFYNTLGYPMFSYEWR